MPILKQTSTRPLMKDAVVLDLGDLGKQAAALKAAAERKAREIVEAAAAEAARLTEGAEAAGREAGHAAGYEAGLAEGREAGRAEALEQAREELAALTERWGGLADVLEARRAELEHEAQDAVLDLALRLAEKVTHRVVEVDRGVVVGQVAAALERVLSPTDAVIVIHPEDRAALEEALPEMLERFTKLKHVSLREDDAVGLGGCRVEFDGGGIDAEIDTQLRRIAELIARGRDLD